MLKGSAGSWKRVLAGNLYRRLRDLRARGLVEEVEAPAGTPDDERQRRTFALTELGRRVAVAEARRLDALVERWWTTPASRRPAPSQYG